MGRINKAMNRIDRITVLEHRRSIILSSLAPRIADLPVL
jgi:hypothetical protein